MSRKRRRENPLHDLLGFHRCFGGTLVLYGSSSESLERGRDVDALLVSTGHKRAECHQLQILTCGHVLPCNLYLVPQSVFSDDVRALAYGGYYAHKVALGFSIVAEEDSSSSPGKLYWEHEWKLHGQHNQIEDARAFMVDVHLQILRYRPTFIRALTKFLQDPERQERLLQFLEREVMVSRSGALVSTLENTERKWLEAFFRFWREYDKHKSHGTGVWSSQTLSKIRASASAEDIALVRQYVGSR